MRAREFVAENRTASAQEVLQYLLKIHPPEETTPFLKDLVLKWPRYELRTVPLSQLKIPDAYYPDDADNERVDPYGRTLWVDYDYAGEVSQRNVDRYPIIVDPQGHIIDGNHRAWAAAELLDRDSIQAWVATDNLKEIGDRPAAHEPNRRRKRSLFHATVDGHWVDVFFDRSDINGTLHITFTVNDNYEAPDQPTSASGSTIKILSTVLAIIRQRLPEYIKKARPPAVSFTAKEDNRARLYRKYFVPVIQNILGPKWTLNEYPNMGMTVFNWRPSKKLEVDENFADGKVKGKSRPGRVKRAGASCKGSVTDLRARAKKYGGERGKMYHWCANMKAGRKK